MKSPLRYPGGKTRARQLIYNKLKEYGFLESTISKLYSPFFGGGSFELFLQEKTNCQIVANDLFTPLHSFWNSLYYNKEELITMIRNNHPTNKENFTRFREQILTLNHEKLTQATYYYIINRCSFSGATLSGGFSQQSADGRFTLKQINQMNDELLTNFEIHNLTFQDFFQQYIPQNISRDELIFLDPPYYIESKLYGNKGDLHENFKHEELARILSNYQRWILCYNDCPYIRDLYKTNLIIPVEWSYGMNSSKKSNEIFILKI